MLDPEIDKDFLADLYASARNKYKPRTVQTLLVAEAPPNNIERFFYFEDVKSHDSLFLEIMGILYPEMKQKYLKLKRPTHLKEELLENFRADGYWLMNLADVPLGLVGERLEDHLPAFLKKLKQYVTKTTQIILVQADVFKLCYPILKEEGYTVWDDKIPFPGSGQQGVFRLKFRKAIGATE